MNTPVEPGQIESYRLGIARNGDPIVVSPLACENIEEHFFIDEYRYATAVDATKALLAYKLQFALHLTPTDRCLIAGFLRQSTR